MSETKEKQKPLAEPPRIANNHAVSTLPSVRAASRKTRVYVFREFVLKKYGDYLRSGDVVLDMAGGKGDLSWLLRNVDGLDSVVVDPRVTKNHILKSIRYLQEHPGQARERAIPNQPTFQPLAALIPMLKGKDVFEVPKHLRLLVDDDLVSAIREYKSKRCSRKHWAEYWELATARALVAQPLGYKEECANDGAQIANASTALETILSAKLILGFHPDQATDPSLELANLLQIPYCIVPCCVFPKEFPNRRLADGSRVRSYPELITYLGETHKPKIQKEPIPFHFTETAKNLALFALPY